MTEHFRDQAREDGLWLRSSDYRQPCPKCSPTRKKKKDPCLHVTETNTDIKACCHHCGWGRIYDAQRGRTDFVSTKRAATAPARRRNRWW